MHRADQHAHAPVVRLDALDEVDAVPRFQHDVDDCHIGVGFRDQVQGVGDGAGLAADLEIGLAGNAQGQSFVLSRPRTLKPEDASKAAPPVLVFDQDGKFVKSWGGNGPGYEWVEREHGIHIDSKGFVWIGGNSCPSNGLPGLKPVADDQLLKFDQNGKLIAQFGKSNQSKGNADTANFHRPADAWLHTPTNELFIADGYGNHRVIVYDAETGKYKRHWGAYGHVPDDTDPGNYNPDAPAPQQFRNPVHCADMSVDRLLYVCDRVNDRIQVFKPDGTFVKEAFVAKRTLGSGSAWDIAFSKDPEQKYIYLADGENDRIHILLRDTLEVLTTFGEGGRQPGEFYGPHSIATDSKGNIYVTETYRGQRVQKFVYKGLGPVTKEDQGVLWPHSMQK